jgi:hypothetical protein
VPTLVEFVVVDEFGIRALGPTPGGLILLARKNAHGHRNGDALGVEKATLVLPIETRRRDPRVCQPIKRDVVEDLVTRQFAAAGWPSASLWSRSQAAKPTGESATPYKVCRLPN